MTLSAETWEAPVSQLDNMLSNIVNALINFYLGRYKESSNLTHGLEVAEP